MELELARLGPTGVKAAAFSCAGVSAGLRELASQWRALTGPARDTAEKCRSVHNPEEFFRRLLGLFKEPARTPSTS
jgi:hypothetical protein